MEDFSSIQRNEPLILTTMKNLNYAERKKVDKRVHMIPFILYKMCKIIHDRSAALE